MTDTTKLTRQLLWGCASATALVASWPAMAQTSSDGTRPASDEEIVVTASSRVIREGFDAPNPTTVIDDTLIKNNAVTSVGQLSKLMPTQSELNSPTAFTQGYSGVAGTTFNLRGLGSTRTLVLVDGRRHVPSSTGTGMNVDVIPSSLIQRVEIVSGGASADWGSDAVAGVINVVLKDRLDGFEGNVQAGIADEGDHANYLASLAWGTSFADDRARILVGGEWYRNEGILLQADRDWSAKQYGLIRNPAYAEGNGQYQFILAPDFQSSSATLGGLILSGVARGTDFGPGGVSRPFVPGQYFNPASFAVSPTGTTVAGQSMSGGSGVSPGLYVPIEQPVERYAGFGRLSFDVSDAVTLFAEGSYSKITGRSPTAFAHDAGIIFGAPFTISIDNAYLPDNIRGLMEGAGETSFKMGRYNTDFGFVQGKSVFETIRAVAGVRGDLGKFKWQAYYQYGQSTEDALAKDTIYTARLANAVDSVLVGNVATCRINADAVATNDDAACRPLNLFGEGAPDQAALDYIHGDATRRTRIEEHVGSLNVTGDPFSTWAGPVSVAFGAEYRSDKIAQISDPVSQAGGFFLGQTASALTGKVSVTELYGQTVVPLLSNSPIARNLELLGAIRHSFYTAEGPVTFPAPGTAKRDFDATTWKIGVTWSVFDGLRLRGVRSRDIRAPNVNELFTAGNRSTVSVFTNGTTVQFPRFRGGNINLTPEKADTLILGGVIEPAFIPGFQLSVDWYDIKLKGAIAAAAGTPQQLIDACTDGNQEICALFTFENGVPVELRGTNVNINQFRSTGWDIEARYRFAALGGDVSLGIVATHPTELSQTTTIAKIDRVGENGNNNSFRQPNWQFSTHASYSRGPFNAYLGGRFVSAGKYNIDYNQDGALNLANNRIPARYYLTASASLDILNTGNRMVQIYGVVNNLLDTDPPVHPQDFQIPIQGSGLYDVIGRAYTVGVRFKY
ncbi:putative TonB-dependent receptor-like protein [uncultured Sphingopyxis sp.]|uniref:Putative TonB-dependent receptor-like protein n=1 Tax=uncultured Sphingopyxis sp. TaxID=310581 RepID=A0A1Y5PY14_9SPHN|nr:TonB-dependent receptor [uncultured Sphingopyxis sp.]SBV32387.1 putative TonB-dependent receptor-like protein [uncultured Sphingopyxis sp.]